MSNTANWSYTNTATVRPFLSHDSWTGEDVYGPEYTIKCTWTAEASQQRDNTGAEFVSQYIIFTEDKRPKYLDMILLNGSDNWQEIRSRTEWDMSPFGEEPDFKLIT